MLLLEGDLGTFRVDIDVSESRRARAERVEALVDTGATYTMLPDSLLRGLGVSPITRLGFTLADGRRVERDVGEAYLRIGDLAFHSPVVFGYDGADALLGAVTLQIFGLGADPLHERLAPLEGMYPSLTRVGD